MNFDDFITEEVDYNEELAEKNLNDPEKDWSKTDTNGKGELV